MNTKTNVLRYSAKLLLLLSILFWGIPTSQATSYRESTSQREVSASELLPVKPKAKSVKKAKKIKKADKKKGTDVGWFLGFAIAAVLGATLFGIGIGFGIFGLWLAGLIIFGLFNLLNSTVVYSRDDFLAMLVFIYFFFITLSNVAIFLGFLLWGLIVATPIIWIMGLAALVFALAQLMSMLILPTEIK